MLSTRGRCNSLLFTSPECVKPFKLAPDKQEVASFLLLSHFPLWSAGYRWCCVVEKGTCGECGLYGFNMVTTSRVPCTLGIIAEFTGGFLFFLSSLAHLANFFFFAFRVKMSFWWRAVLFNSRCASDNEVLGAISQRRQDTRANNLFNLITGCDTPTDCRIHLSIGAGEDATVVTELSAEKIGKSTRRWRCTYQEAQGRYSGYTVNSLFILFTIIIIATNVCYLYNMFIKKECEVFRFFLFCLMD